MSLEAIPVTIANGQSLSDAVDLGDKVLCAIQMPDAWTTASLTLQASYDGVTFADVSAGGEYEVSSVAASKFLLLHTSYVFTGIRYLKIRSGTSGTPVNQGADRTLQLMVRSPTCSISVNC